MTMDPLVLRIEEQPDARAIFPVRFIFRPIMNKIWTQLCANQDVGHYILHFYLFLVFQEKPLPALFHYSALGFFQRVSRKGLLIPQQGPTNSFALTLTQPHVFLCYNRFFFFFKEGSFFQTPIGARQYTVTNDCILKLKTNKQTQCNTKAWPQ